MKKNNLGYDLNYAIGIRQLTWLQWFGPEIYLESKVPDAKKRISFKDSISIARDENWNPYDAPSQEHEVAYHCKSANGTHYEKITKKEWKKAWQDWRKYISQSNDMPDCSPAGEGEGGLYNEFPGARALG